MRVARRDPGLTGVVVVEQPQRGSPGVIQRLTGVGVVEQPQRRSPGLIRGPNGVSVVPARGTHALSSMAEVHPAAAPGGPPRRTPRPSVPLLNAEVRRGAGPAVRPPAEARPAAAQS